MGLHGRAHACPVWPRARVRGAAHPQHAAGWHDHAQNPSIRPARAGDCIPTPITTPRAGRGHHHAVNRPKREYDPSRSGGGRSDPVPAPASAPRSPGGTHPDYPRTRHDEPDRASRCEQTGARVYRDGARDDKYRNSRIHRPGLMGPTRSLVRGSPWVVPIRGNEDRIRAASTPCRSHPSKQPNQPTHPRSRPGSRPKLRARVSSRTNPLTRAADPAHSRPCVRHAPVRLRVGTGRGESAPRPVLLGGSAPPVFRALSLNHARIEPTRGSPRTRNHAGMPVLVGY